MDFQRIIAFFALSFTLLMLWQAWQEDYGPKPAPAATAQAPGQPQGQAPGQPQSQSPGQDVPPPVAEAPAPTDVPGRAGLGSDQRVRVYTDVFYAEIDTYGGDLRKVELVKFPVSEAQPDKPVTLLADKEEIFVAQSGLRAVAATSSSDATHHARYEAAAPEYRLSPGQDTVEVLLRWNSPEGLAVEKVYTFHRGSYAVEVNHRLVNNGNGEWRGNAYYQWLRSRPAEGGSRFVYTYTGGVISGQGTAYEKVEFDDMDETNLSRKLKDGWAAMIQHYFLGAWIPDANATKPADATNLYYSLEQSEGRYVLGVATPIQAVAPGATGVFPAKLYVGPKEQQTLAQVAPNLELTVDYGVLTLIAKPIYWLLEKIHQFLGNWGWSIVVLTLLIKLAFYKLSETSYKSMAHMRKVQPRLVALKERYGDDRQKLNEAMMKMYREEKINPLGGCLPILVQIPVFIALYWVLLESVELRQADWILWIKDLSTADPYFVLPLLMGVTMLIQHRLNPTPMDPVQAKVMLILPIVFTVFFAFFPAGLVLYWVVNNTLSILQQWYITRWVVKA